MLTRCNLPLFFSLVRVDVGVQGLALKKQIIPLPALKQDGRVRGKDFEAGMLAFNKTFGSPLTVPQIQELRATLEDDDGFVAYQVFFDCAFYFSLCVLALVILIRTFACVKTKRSH